MDYVKDNWVEGEVFKDSDLNNIARTLNELADKRENIINDTEAGDNSVYSSNKIEEEAEAAKASVINDEEVSRGSTCSSSKVLETIERSKFKAAIVDELPEVGEENTIYFTPKEDTTEILYKIPMLMYNGENDVISIDMDRFPNDESVGELSGISVGDIIRYKAPDLEEQIFMETTYGSHNTGSEIIYSYYVNTGTTLFSGKYNIGDTFKCEQPKNHDCLITSYDNVSMNWSNLSGVESHTKVVLGNVYRLTGYQQIPDDLIAESDSFKNNYYVYVAKFEEVAGATEADHVVERLGSVFVKNKPSTKQYIVPSEIDKERLMGMSELTFDYGDLNLQVIDGVVGKITLQDGHCYRLKDRYTLKTKNTCGNYMLTNSALGYGVEALIYEEVSASIIPTYEDIDFVPGAMCLYPHVYNGKIRGGCYSCFADGLLATYIPYGFFDVPANLTVGNTLKITGNNPIVDVFDKACCVTSVRDNVFLRGDMEAVIFGISGVVEFEKNECYRLVRLIRLDNGRLNFDDEFSEEMVPGISVEGMIPVFEKVSNPEKIDHEVNGLPGLIISVIGAKQTRDKWMWINGKWERIGGPSIDEELDENIVPDNNNNDNGSNALSILG